MGIGNIGWTEFIVILAFALIFFGPRRLPGIANTLGKSLREFQKALNEVRSEIAQAGREADVREATHRTTPQRPSLPAGASLEADQPTAEGAGPETTEGTSEVRETTAELTPDTATGPVATAAAMSARTSAEPAESSSEAEPEEREPEPGDAHRASVPTDDELTEAAPGESASEPADSEERIERRATTPGSAARPTSGETDPKEETRG